MYLFWEEALAATKETESEPGFFLLFTEKFLLAVFAIFVFFCALVLASFVKNIVVQKAISSAKYELNEELLVLLGRTVYFFIVTLGTVIAFRIVGIDFSTVLGFLAVGIGFAFKDLIANMIAGVVILTQKKIKIGDVIKINKEIGKIIEIDVRTTLLKSLDGVLLIVPNADLLTNTIENFTANTFRRICLQVGVDYATPLAEAIQLTLQITKTNPNILQEPAPQVIATEFGDSAIMLDIRFWVESQTQNWPIVQSELIQKIKIAYENANIKIPFPIRTVTLENKAQTPKKQETPSNPLPRTQPIPPQPVPQTVVIKN